MGCWQNTGTENLQKQNFTVPLSLHWQWGAGEEKHQIGLHPPAYENSSTRGFTKSGYSSQEVPIGTQIPKPRFPLPAVLSRQPPSLVTEYLEEVEGKWQKAVPIELVLSYPENNILLRSHCWSPSHNYLQRICLLPRQKSKNMTNSQYLVLINWRLAPLQAAGIQYILLQLS